MCSLASERGLKRPLSESENESCSVLSPYLRAFLRLLSEPLKVKPTLDPTVMNGWFYI